MTEKILLDTQAKLRPGDKNADVIRFNLGWHQLRNGRFKLGMEYLGIGRKLKIWGAYTLRRPEPLVDATSDLSGKTVLLMGEGGAGDARGGRGAGGGGAGAGGVSRSPRKHTRVRAT